jgi:hypothetical protein
LFVQFVRYNVKVQELSIDGAELRLLLLRGATIVYFRAINGQEKSLKKVREKFNVE